MAEGQHTPSDILRSGPIPVAVDLLRDPLGTELRLTDSKILW